MARRSDPTHFRLSVRVFVFGIWSVLAGLVVIYFASRAGLAVTAIGTASASESVVPLQSLLSQTLGAVYHGGVTSFGVGVTLMTTGGMLLRSKRGTNDRRRSV